MSHREELEKAFAAEFRQVWDPSPPLLYRYVPDARAGDIRAGSLYASNLAVHARTSDMLEFRLGWGIIRTTAEAIAKQADDDDALRNLCNAVVDDKNPFENGYTAYAVCLTTQSDSDHMWKHFGSGDMTRFGFTTRELFAGIRNCHVAYLEGHKQHLSKDDEDEDWDPAGFFPHFLAVHYEADDLITAVEGMIRKVAMPLVNRRMATAPLLSASAAANTPKFALRDVFVPMALSFKRAKFKPEREWRIVLAGMRGDGDPPNGIRLTCTDPRGSSWPLPITDELVDPKRRAI